MGVVGKGRPNRCIALIYACDISSWIFTQSIPILGLQGTGGDWVELKAVDAGAVSLQPVPHTGPDSAWGTLNTKPVPAQ